MKRVPVVLLMVAAFASGSLSAQAELATSVPANGAMIAAAPENLDLTFAQPVRLTAVTIQKSGERKQSLGPLPAETATEFSVVLPQALDDGHYVVSWRATPDGLNVVSGDFMFAVGADGTHDAHMNHTMPGHAMPDHAMPGQQSPAAGMPAEPAEHGATH